jgi:thiamine pyrophosphokinase
MDSFPPSDLTSCIAIICNGEMDELESAAKRIKQCKKTIVVDGGFHHCLKMDLKPCYVVGDLDSIEPKLLEKIDSHVQIIRLERAKDQTDTEQAIKTANTLCQDPQILVFGGLGGRLDHTLNHLLFLLKHPLKLFLESKEQLVFALNDVSGEINIADKEYKTMALFPLSGAAHSVLFKTKEAVYEYPIVDKSKLFAFPFDEHCSLAIGKGELIVILDKRDLTLTSSQKDAAMRFTLKQPLIQILDDLRYQSLHYHEGPLLSKEQRVFNIQATSGKCLFNTQVGTTVSLIPFYGPAKEIVTERLGWELGPVTGQEMGKATHLDHLTKDFASISNIAMSDTFSIQLQDGELLCIITDSKIDQDMVKRLKQWL